MMTFAPSFGVKLPLDWRAPAIRERLGLNAAEPYSWIADLGLGHVEFGVGICGEQEAALLAAETAACRAAGLRVAMHPYLGGPANSARFGEEAASGETLLRILRLASALAPAGGQTTLVLHGAEFWHEHAPEAAADLRPQLLERTRQWAAAAQDAIDRWYPAVNLVLEHQVPPAPGEKIIRIGDTWRELLAAVAQVRLGVCWDTGHSLLSVIRNGQEEQPPAAILGRVRAMHLHAVVNGEDHWPLSADAGRLRGYLELLRGCDFTGTISLEYSLAQIANHGGLYRTVAESWRMLREW